MICGIGFFSWLGYIRCRASQSFSPEGSGCWTDCSKALVRTSATKSNAFWPR